MKSERNSGFRMTTLIACIADMPHGSDCRDSAGITATENPNSSPPTSPEPSAAVHVGRAVQQLVNGHRLRRHAPPERRGSRPRSGDRAVGRRRLQGRRGPPGTPAGPDGPDRRHGADRRHGRPRRRPDEPRPPRPLPGHRGGDHDAGPAGRACGCPRAPRVHRPGPAGRIASLGSAPLRSPGRSRTRAYERVRAAFEGDERPAA